MTHPILCVRPLTFVDHPLAAQAIHWYMIFILCIKELSQCCHSRSCLVYLHHTRQIQWCVLKVLLHLALIHAVMSLPLHSRESHGALQNLQERLFKEAVHAVWFHTSVGVSFVGPLDTLLSGGSLEGREHGSFHLRLTWLLGCWRAEVNFRNRMCTDFGEIHNVCLEPTETLLHSFGEADLELLIRQLVSYLSLLHPQSCTHNGAE